MVELPTAWEHQWNAVALISGQNDSDNVWTEIQDKCVQACPEPNGTRDTQTNPVEGKYQEVNRLLALLNKVSMLFYLRFVRRSASTRMLSWLQ
jgi:hypothetical protein